MCLEFERKRRFWFPENTNVGAELWSEYLCVFWESPANGHYYVRADTAVSVGDIVLDCGACEGFFTRQAVELGADRIVCFEPNPMMANCLRLTFQPEIEKGLVLVVEAAASAINGSCDFSYSEGDPFSGGSSTPGAGISVKAITIDQVVKELKLERCDYLKMDIEGGEIAALEGAGKVLDSYGPKVAVTTYHRDYDYLAIYPILVSRGYRVRGEGLTRRETSVFRPVMIHGIKTGPALMAESRRAPCR